MNKIMHMNIGGSYSISIKMPSNSIIISAMAENLHRWIHENHATLNPKSQSCYKEKMRQRTNVDLRMVNEVMNIMDP
ncbi:MAG: hypothetical protein U0T81_10485 [Saprospiraceae bacterium]